MERSLSVITIIIDPQSDSITRDAMLTTDFKNNLAFKEMESCGIPLKHGGVKKSFLQKCHLAEWAVSNSALSLSLVRTMGVISSSLVSGIMGY